MKIDTNFPLVDVQPLYNALAEFQGGPGDCSRAQRAFFREKILEATKRMRDAATYVEAVVKKVDAERKKSR